jgi:hypothetical protein
MTRSSGAADGFEQHNGRWFHQAVPSCTDLANPFDLSTAIAAMAERSIPTVHEARFGRTPSGTARRAVNCSMKTARAAAIC